MLRQGMSLVLIGLELGLAGAFATTRLMSALLFEVSNGSTYVCGRDGSTDNRGPGRLFDTRRVERRKSIR